MELNKFRNSTKVEFNENLIESILGDFIKSNLPFYNQRTSLMSCIELDPFVSGKVDAAENEEFMNEMMLNMCYDQCHGKDEFNKLDKNNQVKMGSIFYKRIKKQIFECGQVVYDMSGVNQEDDYKDMEHEFIIKVNAGDFIYALNSLYRHLRACGLDNIRIVTPSTRFICAGYNAPIKIRCNSEHLEETLKFLDEMEDELINIVFPVHPIYHVAYAWYGYEQVRNDGITSTSVLTNAIYDAINDVVSDYIKDDYLMSDGTLCREFYQEYNNKHVALRVLLNEMLTQDYDHTLNSIAAATEIKLSRWNIDKNDCLRYAEVNEKLNELFGEVLSDDEYRELKAKEALEAKKNELKEQIDDNDVIRRITNNSGDIRSDKQAVDVVNMDYMSLLGGAFSNVLSGENPQIVSDGLKIVEDYRDLERQEKIGFDQNLTESEPANNSQSNLESVSRGIDLAIKAIEEAEQREMEANNRSLSSDLDLIDISGGATPKVDQSKVVNIPVGESSNLNSFASGKTEVLTDDIETVKGILASENKGDSKGKPERVNPDSYCLDYITEDGVLIPDLKDVSYRGNNLVEALKDGGNQTSLDNIKAIASHFGLTDYEGTKEQNNMLLDILRHLDNYEMDGTVKGTGVKAFASNNSNNQSQVSEEVSEPQSIIIEDATKKDEEEAPQEQIQLTVTPLDIEYNAKFRDSYKYKYSQYVKDTKILDTPVAGTDYTVLDYFMHFDLYSYYKSDSVFVLHEDGIKVNGFYFTMNYLIPYLTNYGPEDLNVIMSYFVEEILPPGKQPKR